MIQKWNMFAPTVLGTEKWIVAEAILNDGTSTLLFTNYDEIPTNFDIKFFPEYKNQFWRKFFSRLNKKSNQRYIKEFRTWLMRTDHFDEILGGKRINNVKLWQLSESSPKLGKSKREITKFELKNNSSSKRKKSKTTNKKGSNTSKTRTKKK